MTRAASSLMHALFATCLVPALADTHSLQTPADARAVFASTHVLRRAGIESVTLCIAAINKLKLELETLDAPFNVVLFDSADFRAQGGAAFRDTHFFRDMLELEKN